MKKFLLLGLLFLLVACTLTLEEDDACPVDEIEDCDDSSEQPTEAPDLVACPQDAKQCPDGSFVGRVEPDCEFAECPVDPRVFCEEEQRYADACAEIYDPVCGYFGLGIQCVKAPCAVTVSNPCFACQNKDIEYYLPGECPA